VGVEARDSDRVDEADGECKFAGMWGLELGVEGLEPWDDGLCLSAVELVETGRGLEGVEDRDAVGREEGVEGLDEDEERAIGEDGLM